MTIRPMTQADAARAAELWSESAERGETVYKPMTAEKLADALLSGANYDPKYHFACEEDGRVIGFVSGVAKKVFLPGESAETTPGYLTAIYVDEAARGRGVGRALVETLAEAFRLSGKQAMVCSSLNPVNLSWIVPGTPGHDHNNAPGVDTACPGYAFLQKCGFSPQHRECAMYLNLAEYRRSPAVDEIRARLASEGVYTGRYDVTLGYDFDGMCDRVGSEYWRKVLRDEIASPNPRPILVGTHENRIVGFTGPVDKEASGRGWFTGICVDPLYERRGIGTAIFNLLMGEFVKEGAAFSTLFTGSDNHAQKMYLRTGFRVAREFDTMKRVLE